MPGVNLSIPSSVLVKIDQERRWIGRSAAVTKALEYILSQEGTLRQLCGADKIPEEYKS